MSDQFVVHRLRSKPIEYTVTIRHFVIAGEWQMSVMVQDVGEDQTNRERVAFDLRYAADLLAPQEEVLKPFLDDIENPPKPNQKLIDLLASPPPWPE